MNFKRTIEDFECEHCGTRVIGNGYTNHCPECLWSKHVDVHPGDREAACLGLMAPLRLETKDGHERVVQQCLACGHQRTNKVQKEDNRDALYALAKGQADELSGTTGKKSFPKPLA